MKPNDLRPRSGGLPRPILFVLPVVEPADLWKPGSDSKRKLGDWLFYRAKTDDLVVLDDLGAEKASGMDGG